MLPWVLAALTTFACTGDLRPAIVAHRGGMDSGLPENTLPAFRRAAAAGVHAIELDLRATRDGEVVVLHDATVDRTTNGRGFVHALSSDALRRLEAGDGIPVPRLQDVLAEAATLDVEWLLDLKPAPRLDLEAVVEQVAAHHQLDRTIFGVRSLDDRNRLARAQPGLRLLAFARRPQQIDDFLAAGVEIVRLWPRWLDRDPELVERIHAAGAQVWVTAGDAPLDELRLLVARQVDGVLTDLPETAVAGLDCR